MQRRIRRSTCRRRRLFEKAYCGNKRIQVSSSWRFERRSLTMLRVGLWSRWKERYFVLTSDYLTCFKKPSYLSNFRSIGSNMGAFSYKVQLCEIASIEWKSKNAKKNCSSSKKHSELISIQLVGDSNKIDLWSSSKATLNEWMYALKEATSRSRDRRAQFLKKSQTVCTVPQPFALSLWATEQR